ncbi:MAG: M43 family zinc metalloprotease [Bacteroidia bacterium]
MQKSTLLLSLFFITQFANAQQQCGTYEYESYLNDKFPGYSKALDQTRQQSLEGLEKLNKADADSVYRIPVVFHVVWNNAKQNLHDSLIFSQLKALNESYRHTHKDTGKVRAIFKPVAGDTRIEFYLATKDPNGNLTNGINRINTARSDFGEGFSAYADGVKSTVDQGVDAWDPEKYLNIWVCKFTYNGTLIVSAYAYPPVNAQFWNAQYYKSLDLQGVVVNYQYVGYKNPNDIAGNSIRERTLVHEVGHYLGLRHIWADKQNICTGEDDGFKDTPLARSATTSCTPSKNTCNEGTGDKPDMIENYMDYSPYPCTVMFTQMQAKLMRYNLVNLRPKLYQLKTNQPPPPPPPVYTQIAVTPNPVVGQLKIVFPEKGDYKMSITDIIGQQVNSSEFKVGDNFEFTSSLNLAAGFYYLNIANGSNTVLKQKILVK